MKSRIFSRLMDTYSQAEVTFSSIYFLFPGRMNSIEDISSEKEKKNLSVSKSSFLSKLLSLSTFGGFNSFLM